MRYCGTSEYFHDAGIAFLSQDGDIEFAAHSERYTKIKYDRDLSLELVNMIQDKDITVFYENIEDRKYTNEEYDIHSFEELHDRGFIANTFDYDFSVNHHLSHAALAYLTRPWTSKEDTVILTIDGVGQHQSVGIYDHNFNLKEKVEVPQTVGLFYGVVTSILKLKVNFDEYQVMGLASYGEPTLFEKYLNIYEANDFDFRNMLKHVSKGETEENIAASIQKLAEVKILEYAQAARKYGSKLVYAGGVAENIVANTLIRPLFDDMWVPTAPGDAGSALGCAAYIYAKQNNVDRINWKSPYLGYDIKRDINPKEVVNYLMSNKVCGVANGRAEFGPRALGNRSLIADVRYDVKDTVNDIKRRQRYRPFAPAILEEFVDDYFEGYTSEYMKYTAKSLHDYKSVTHVDGSARVQVVKKDCESIIRPILEEYYERTGVPMLLNTSLNIRGMPMVNDEKDATVWEKHYKVKIF